MSASSQESLHDEPAINKNLNAFSVQKSNSMEHYEPPMNVDCLKDVNASRGMAAQAGVPIKAAWSSLAQQNTGGMGPGNMNRNIPMDSFQQFKKQAKEKLDRQKQQEIRKQAEKERMMRYEQPDKRSEEVGMDRARRPVKSDGAPPPLLPKVESIKMSPSGSPADMEKSEREKQRMKEQERRRREARAGQIDMNLQSELLAAFEENVL